LTSAEIERALGSTMTKATPMQVARLRFAHLHVSTRLTPVQMIFGSILLTKVAMVSAITTVPFKPQEMEEEHGDCAAVP
jgi:hypothetical protein